MAQGCIGVDPLPLNCCPLSEPNGVGDPDPLVYNCVGGYEPGSLYFDTSVSPTKVWMMTACPDEWQCFINCDDNKYFLSTYKNDGDGLRQSIPSGSYTIIDFTSSQYEYPSGVGAWDGTNTLTVPYSGLYVINYHVVLNLKGLTVNPLTDILALGVINGVTATPLWEMGGPQIYNATGNEFYHLVGGVTVQLVAGENFTLQIVTDAGVNIPTVNNFNQSPLFPEPRAGFLTVSQIR